MTVRRNKGKPGFTLTELIVVMAIIAITAALAIPTLTNLGLFSRDELGGAAREVFTMLKAARSYAAAYGVRTAVVYNLDNYVPLSQNPANAPGLPSPIIENSCGELLRIARSAAVMYQLEGSWGRFSGFLPSTQRNVLLSNPAEGDRRDFYVPIPEPDSNFSTLPGGMVMPLISAGPLPNSTRSLTESCSFHQPVYKSRRPQFQPEGSTCNPNSVGPHSLGLFCGLNVMLDGGPFAAPGSPAFSNPEVGRFTAHVFNPSGRVDTLGNKERFTFLVAPPPDFDPRGRFINPDQPVLAVDTDGDGRRDQSNLIGIPIQLYRSTGRVKIAQ